MILLLLLVISCSFLATANVEVETDLQGMMFLYRFGYLTEEDMNLVQNMEDSNTKDMMKEALEEFQERSGLPITGEMDHTTKEEMSLSRCGVKDIIPFGKQKHSREKRYLLGRTRWRTPRLSYRFIRLRNGNQARVDFQQEMERAFRSWSAVSPLTFRRVTNPRDPVDINIQFASRSHGDSNNFDGPAGRSGPVLAHAFYPNPGIGGDIHFDDEENWVTNRSGGVDFYAVALHELGHSIGLDHSTERGAVMFPTYSGYRSDFRLHGDDIAGVRALYGFSPPSGRTPFRRRPGSATSGAPALCDLPRIDAAFCIPNSEDIYIFSASQCYLLQQGVTGKTADGYPRAISTEFPGVEITDHVDAALAWPNGQIFIFEGRKVWILRNLVLEAGSPRDISGVFPGIPDDLSGACLWPRDQLTYFFKGEFYWRYDNTSNSREAVKPYFPRPIRRWSGVSESIDAVLEFNSDTYFFKNGSHYRYSNRAFRVYPGYPRNTKEDLFGCNSRTIPPNEEEEVDKNGVNTAETTCQNIIQDKDLGGGSSLIPRRQDRQEGGAGGKGNSNKKSGGRKIRSSSCMITAIILLIFR